jgi:hypothetical protein
MIITTQGGGGVRVGGSVGGVGGGGGGKQVFVGGLPWSTTWQQLKDAFSSVGTVELATGGRDPPPPPSLFPLYRESLIKYTRAHENDLTALG